MHVPTHAGLPDRDLALATHMAQRHAAPFPLSASDCETLPLADLLALADAEDHTRWNTLRLGYTDPLGAPWLRDAVSAGYQMVTHADLICFAGAQESLYAALHALLAPGDHAIVVLPCYQSMETLPMGLCDVSGVALDAADDWSLDFGAIARAIRPNTRMIAISFPNNPTGKQLEQDRFAALVELCRHHGIWLLSDEVYRHTEPDPAIRLPPAADVYERGISLGVLSKAYGLPGLRIGWVACRDAGLLKRIGVIHQYLSTCNAAPSEVLACIALKAGRTILARNRAIAASNLVALQAMLARHPDLFQCMPPQAGVVCYPRYTGRDGVEAFVDRMETEAGVMLLPASVFRSRLADLPPDHFRIGFGHQDFLPGLAALEQALPSGTLSRWRERAG